MKLNTPELLAPYYKSVIRHVVKMGGDTDTNACIVGGMIGALVGVKNVDRTMLQTLLKFDCESQNIKRPAEFSVRKYAIPLIEALIEKSPKSNNHVYVVPDEGYLRAEVQQDPAN